MVRNKKLFLLRFIFIDFSSFFSLSFNGSENNNKISFEREKSNRENIFSFVQWTICCGITKNSLLCYSKQMKIIKFKENQTNKKLFDDEWWWKEKFNYFELTWKNNKQKCFFIIYQEQQQKYSFFINLWSKAKTSVQSFFFNFYDDHCWF